MDIKKADRATLKSYFKKNAIPTESNFAELIEGALNQKDDGIVKQDGEPLSIAAAGDANGPQKVINFYGNLPDQDPAWTLQLNPRADQSKLESAKAGFSISEGQGPSRLFIDKATGNVGVGTITPIGKLDVFTGGDGGWNRFVVNNTNNWGDGNNQYVTIGAGGATGIMIHNPHVSWIARENRASIRLGRSGGVANGAWWDIGTRPNNAFSILRDGALSCLYISENGNIGIGTDSPQAKLDIDGGAFLGYETTITDFGTPLKSGFYQGVDNITGDVPDTTHGWSHLIVSRHSNVGNNHQLQIGATFSANDKLYFRKIAADGTSNPAWNEIATRGANTFKGAQVVNGSIDVTGNVGIGISASGVKLDVADRIRLRQSPNGSAGLWLFQSAPNADRAFIGMSGDSAVGLWGNTGAGWGLTMDTTSADVAIKGRIGTNGLPATPKKSNWGGGIRTWDVEAEGTIWSAHGIDTSPHDLAENYYSEQELEAGDVVILDGTRDGILRSDKPADRLVLGVISTEPGVLLNAEHDDVERTDDKKAYPLALCGRVPCKVTDENGPINPGDLLVSSSTPGHAMKAKAVMVGGVEIYTPGTVIGKALEPLSLEKGVIEVFVFLR